MSDRIREQVEDDRVGLGEAPAGHLSERQLVLSRLGDADDRQVVAEHLQECERCRERALGLDRQLEWIATISSEGIPEVDVGLQDRIWQRQRSNLLQRGIVARAANSNWPGPRPTPPLSRGGGRGRQLDWLRRRTLMPLAAAAAVVAVAFVLGWLLPSPIGRPADEGGPSVLLQTVAAHLDRSQVVLAELVNGVPDKSLNRFVDRAAELVADNRVYRQSARLGQHQALEKLLGELELVLLEVARMPPAAMGPSRLAWLQQRIESGDLLFKVRVARAGADRQTVGAAGARAPTGPM